MKYGIITFHNIPNIGALLQAYALCKTMRQFGKDCKLIDYCCENIVKRELIYHPSRSFFKNILKYCIIWQREKKKIRACQSFMRKQQMYSEENYNKKNIAKANDKYDVFLSGSDMIWNLDVTDYDWTYFLDFTVPEKKRYSYASSIGGKWLEKDYEKVFSCLQRYRMRSVRESDTGNFIEEKFGLTAKLVSDPTLLLDSREWAEIAEKPKLENYILVYFPSSENMQAAKRYAEKEKKKVALINTGIPIQGVVNLKVYEPTEWIGCFMYADAVFTNSYHGLLFSLYFSKEVWTNNTSNRVDSLLKKLNIEQCFLEKDKELEKKLDYEKINLELKNLREESLDYIKAMIQDAEGENGEDI